MEGGMSDWGAKARTGWLRYSFFHKMLFGILRNQREKSKIYKKAKTKYRPYESTDKVQEKQSKLQDW